MSNIFNYIRKMPQGIKASVALFISSLVTKGISFITTPFFTRLLSTNEYGQVSLYYTWLQLFGIVAMFCLYYGVFNTGMVDYPKKRNEFSFSLLMLANIITLLFSVVLFIIYPAIDNYIGLDLPLLLLMCVSFIFQPAYVFWATKQRYELKYKGVVFWACFCALISPVIAILAILFNPGTSAVYNRIFGAEIPLIIIHIGFFIYLGYKVGFKADRGYWKSAFFFNLPLIPHYLSSYLLSSSDRIMIANLIGNEATAFYSVAYSVASIALVIWSAIDSSLVPYTYEHLKRNNIKPIRTITASLLLVFTCGCLLVILFAPEVIWIMGSDTYMEAIYAIPPVVGGTFFQVQYFLYSNIIYYYKKPKYVMIGSLSAMTLNLVLNYLFIPKFGYLAAGFTTLFCYGCQALIDYLAMKKVTGNDIYNAKFVLCLSVIVIAISSLSLLLYRNNILRYILIGVMLLALVVFRKKIISIFATMRGRDGLKSNE